MKIGLIGSSTVNAELLPLVSADVINWLEASLLAAAAGCDALVINSRSEYGLAAIKAAASIPVIGPAEATFGQGGVGALGSKWSLVTVWPSSTNYMYEGLFTQYNFRPQRIRNVFEQDVLEDSAGIGPFVKSMQGGQDGKFDKISAACAKAVEIDEVDYIILGCTCMSPIATKIAERSEVPVVNQFGVAVMTAVMHVRLGLIPKGPRLFKVREESFGLVKRMVESVKSGSVAAVDCDEDFCKM